MSRAKAVVAAIQDTALFARATLASPGAVGAIIPSSRFSGRSMAEAAKASAGCSVLELGAGTGAFTKAFLSAGIAPSDMVLVERDLRFMHLLRKLAVGAEVLGDDAFALAEQWAADGRTFDIIVSGLPFLNFPEKDALRLRDNLLRCLAPEGRIVQITYGRKSPIPLDVSADGSFEVGALTAQKVDIVWRNLPPAHIWLYHLN
ncbi:MAG: methyltransferase domain-containing protein [Pseudomonadota bacterium]